MSKKKRLLLTFILSNVLTFVGVFMKLNHVAYANICMAIGLLFGIVFLYLLIEFVIKVKE